MRISHFCLTSALALSLATAATANDGGFDPYQLYKHVKLKPPAPVSAPVKEWPVVEAPASVAKTSNTVTESWPVTFPPKPGLKPSLKPRLKPVQTASKPAANPMLDIEQEIAAETGKTSIDDVTLLLMNQGKVIAPNSSTAFAPLIPSAPDGLVYPVAAKTKEQALTIQHAPAAKMPKELASTKAKSVLKVTSRQKEILY